MFQLSEAEAPARRLPPPPPAPPAQDGTRGPQGAEDEQAGRWGAVPARPRGGNADCTRVTWGRRREDTRAGGHTDSVQRHLEGGARGPVGPEPESSSACPRALAPDHRALVRTRQPGRPGTLPPHTACAETHPCPPPGPSLCPLQALSEWLRAAEHRLTSSPAGEAAPDAAGPGGSPPSRKCLQIESEPGQTDV